MITRLPVHTTEWPVRGQGASNVDITFQTSPIGLYRRPCPGREQHGSPSSSPHRTACSPVHVGFRQIVVLPAGRPLAGMIRSVLVSGLYAQPGALYERNISSVPVDNGLPE